mmetsp:Transcript_27639/g.82449  ORF Transcript_27639/g.82449 Transcript_27639/m.82449 type:complete len:203 (-) Transcript_27639:444-1052(-)
MRFSGVMLSSMVRRRAAYPGLASMAPRRMTSVRTGSGTPRLLVACLMRSPRGPSSPWQHGMTAKSTPTSRHAWMMRSERTLHAWQATTTASAGWTASCRKTRSNHEGSRRSPTTYLRSWPAPASPSPESAAGSHAARRFSKLVGRHTSTRTARSARRCARKARATPPWPPAASTNSRLPPTNLWTARKKASASSTSFRGGRG